MIDRTKTLIKIQENIVGNTVSYIAFCCLGIFVIYLASSMRIASALFPIILSITLIIFNLSLIFKTFLKWISDRKILFKKKGKEEKITSIREKTLFEIFPFITIIFCSLFVVGFEKIGFDISAFLLAFAIMILINPKEGFRKFYIALLIPFLLIVLFKVGLNVRMPLLIEKLFG